jgi:hypothetical protein
VKRALAILAFLALVLGHAAGEEPELRRHFLSDSTRVGDWSTYEVTLAFEPGDLAALANPKRIFVEYRVKEAGEHCELVTVSAPPHLREWETWRVRKSSRKLRDLLRIPSEVVLSEQIESREEDYAIDGGGHFKCQHLAFTTTEGTLVQQNDCWLGLTPSEFHGLRLVALQARPLQGAARPVTLSLELRGHGRSGSTEWGKTLKELVAERDAVK